MKMLIHSLGVLALNNYLIDNHEPRKRYVLCFSLIQQWNLSVLSRILLPLQLCSTYA